MAGVAGLEPTNGGIKTRCLTNLAIPQQCLQVTISLQFVVQGRVIYAFGDERDTIFR